MAIPMLGVERVVLVVPSLALVRQVKNDYIDAFGLSEDWDVVCSELGSEFTSAVDYIDSGAHVLTTYASLGKIDAYFDLAIFDEAHHTKEDAEFEGAGVSWYFSATLPQNTPLLYSYNFADAIRDGFAQDFCIEVFVRPASKEASLPQLLCDLAKETGNNKLLVFTRFAETEERSVRAWVADNAMAFRDADGWLEYLTGETPARQRTRVLREFEERDGWSVLASCRVLAEGVDTKGADSLLFADPKSSYVDILQNVGRVTRRKSHDRPSSIIVPIFVDPEKYEGTREEVSTQLTKEMKKDGDFRGLCNVLAVMRDHFPDFVSCRQRGSSGDMENEESVPTSLKLRIQVDPSMEIMWSIEGDGDLKRKLIGDVEVIRSREQMQVDKAHRLLLYVDQFGMPYAKSDNETERKWGQFFNWLQRLNRDDRGGLKFGRLYPATRELMVNRFGPSWYEKDREKEQSQWVDRYIDYYRNYGHPSQKSGLKKTTEGHKLACRRSDMMKRQEKWTLLYPFLHQRLKEVIPDFFDQRKLIGNALLVKRATELKLFVENGGRPALVAKKRRKNTILSSEKEQASWSNWLQKLRGLDGLPVEVSSILRNIPGLVYDSDDGILKNFRWDTSSSLEKSALQKMQELEKYVAVHGRLPTVSSENKTTRALGKWLDGMRGKKRGYANGTLYPSVEQRLVKLLGEDWHNVDAIREKKSLVREEQSLATARELQSFFIEKQHLPQNGSKDKREKQLARWFGCQKQAKNGRGSWSCYDSVDRLLSSFLGDDWYKTLDEDAREKKAVATARELQRFFNDKQQLPKNNSNDKHEKQLASWFGGQKQAKNGRCGMICYESVDRLLASFLGDKWHVTRTKRKSSDASSVALTSSSSTVRLVKRPCLAVNPAAKLAGLSREELIQRLTKHQQRVRGKYPAEAREDDADKLWCNTKFVEAASASSDGLVVFLDSPALYTTRRLIDAGISLDRMVCPQLDADEYEAMKDWPHVRAGSLRSVIDTLEPGSVSVIWADYCCTWGGNDQVRPRRDMQLLVGRGILCAGGAVFVTTTLQHVSREDSMQAMHEMDHEVFKGWLVDAPRVYASGQMLFKGFRSKA
jgi:hypothetical protein